MSSRLGFFRWLISVGRWQTRDLGWKVAVMVEEEEGNSDISCGCTATSWLQVPWSQQWCNYNRRKMGQLCARLLWKRTAAIRSERPLLVMFNSLLATIKIVSSEILLQLRCRQIIVKDRYW
ncbi:hypothetical protein BHE74_00007505 [Ensete ventricosum]|uniref:Uncharacterized protein n=1 Tax=Ensete ventricosum TaxID=4639 RepID=A0A445ME17_ENSVE|nr:hypothetical protein BHE74_00007505 [Ensete ventricosum]RZR72446.1 hypothetical protein BHM03_00013543 [Ensete ventricosum]